MVLSHVTDSWTREADRQSEPYYALSFIAGVASPLFLFLAGVAMAMAAGSKGPVSARRRGWEIFALGLVFRLQSQVLGMGPLESVFKVDMLNVMGLTMVAAARVWQIDRRRPRRLAALAAVTLAIAMVTPIVRDLAWLSWLPDPLEAYLRPAGGYAAFPIFPWSGFLFAGVIVGDLVDAARRPRDRAAALQNALIVCGGAGVMLGWLASFRPAIYPSASFWHDSPTFFFVRLGLVTLLVPVAWVLGQLLPSRALQPVVTMGRSSLFVYWIHVEMVYGVVADPLKRALPLWMSLAATATLILGLYAVVLLKNRLLERYELRGPWRILAPVIR
jgi:uncharacterized membrane protein